MGSSLGNCYIIVISGEPLNSAAAFVLKIYSLVRRHLQDDWGGGGGGHLTKSPVSSTGLVIFVPKIYPVSEFSFIFRAFKVQF